MAPLEVHQFMCRSDNYGVLLHDHQSGATAAIDAPDAQEIESQLKKRGWQLTHILTTHHHKDHTEGNLALKELFGCRIIGPAVEAASIPGIGTQVSGGDNFQWAGRKVDVLACPGHTKGHIAYHMPGEYMVFAGDTVFSLGCGRVIEGTMAEMWNSVNQFRKLSPSTYLYCGHEYTEANGRFAMTVEPANRALQQRVGVVTQLRQDRRMTCPTTIGEELKTNPFLRPESAEIRRNLKMETASDADVFAALRQRKDQFR